MSNHHTNYTHPHQLNASTMFIIIYMVITKTNNMVKDIPSPAGLRRSVVPLQVPWSTVQTEPPEEK